MNASREIRLQVMWNRLLAVVEEQAQTLVRTAFATYDRVTHPPRGREGGANGMAGRVSLGSGAPMKGMGRRIIPAGDRVVIEMPGGGGYGNPAERDVERIHEDVRSELVSREAAERDYGIVINAAGDVDGRAGTRDGQ